MLRFKLFFCALVFVVLSSCAEAAVNTVKNDSIETKKDTPADFNLFIDSCSQEEKELLLKVLRSETAKGNSEAVKKALVYRAYNKLTYLFRGHDDVNYHGIVQWAAAQCDIPKEQIKALSTFFLERKIAEKYFADIWNVLSVQQKNEMLQNIGEPADVKESLFAVFDKDPLALMDSFFSSGLSYEWIPGLFSKLFGGGFAEKDAVCSFIMAVHSIKSQKIAHPRQVQGQVTSQEITQAQISHDTITEP